MRRRKGKTSQMLIKIDLEKAYDRLTWNCIRDTLEKTGLPHSWIWNSMHCIETVEMKITWNGKTLEGFKPSRGIRQGDPISLFLIVLCMERLGHVINKVVEEGKWKPIKLNRYCPPLTHLFFADDLLLFGEASENQMEIIL